MNNPFPASIEMLGDKLKQAVDAMLKDVELGYPDIVAEYAVSQGDRATQLLEEIAKLASPQLAADWRTVSVALYSETVKHANRIRNGEASWPLPDDYDFGR